MGTALPRPTPALDEAPQPRWETITVRTLVILSAVCWVAGMALIATQTIHPFLSAQAFIVVGFWDLVLACLGTGLAPNYSGADQRATHLWRAVRTLSETDRQLIAANRRPRPLVARPWLWRLASYFACICWALAAGYTLEVEGGIMRPDIATLSVTLVFLLAGGCQGTIATFTGLARARQERTYDIALYGPAVNDPYMIPEVEAVAAAALDERRDDTGSFRPINSPLRLLRGDAEYDDSHATGA
jgi:hypothetical protein